MFLSSAAADAVVTAEMKDALTVAQVAADVAAAAVRTAADADKKSKYSDIIKEGVGVK